MQQKYKEQRDKINGLIEKFSPIGVKLSELRQYQADAIKKINDDFAEKYGLLVEKEEIFQEAYTEATTELKAMLKEDWNVRKIMLMDLEPEELEKLKEEQPELWNKKGDISKQIDDGLSVRVTSTYAIDSEAKTKEILKIVKEQFPDCLTYDTKQLITIAKTKKPNDLEEDMPFIVTGETVTPVIAQEFYESK